MPSAQTLVVFVLVAAGFVAVPGPSNLMYVIATAAGLSALIASSQTVFAAIHYAGAAYLCWLGVTVLRSSHRAALPEAAEGPAAVWPAYRQGVIVELGNPKVALFFLALFPQFLHAAAGPAWVQVLVLGAIFVALGLLSDCAYAVGSGRVRAWLLKRPRRLGHQQRATGVLYLGLGVWAALSGAQRAAPAPR
jgi:threonine/homoserine/homoserine lactone efflux protein